MEIKVFQLIHYEIKFLKLKEAETQSTGLFSSTSILMGNVSRSVVPDSATPWTAARQAPLSMEFFRQEDWSG